MGANDTITTDFELKIGMKTDRNTVEYISIPHPKQNLSEATVKAAAERQRGEDLPTPGEPEAERPHLFHFVNVQAAKIKKRSRFERPFFQ